jgi:hypothetical protein
MKLPIQASAVSRETYRWCARAFASDSVGARASVAKHHVPGARPEFACGTNPQKDVLECTCQGTTETACCGGPNTCHMDADLCLCN